MKTETKTTEELMDYLNVEKPTYVQCDLSAKPGIKSEHSPWPCALLGRRHEGRRLMRDEDGVTEWADGKIVKMSLDTLVMFRSATVAGFARDVQVAVRYFS